MIFPSQKVTLTKLLDAMQRGGGFLLTGPEGIGKTEIAEEAVARHLSIKPGGEHPGLARILPDDSKATPVIGVDQIRGLVQTMRHTAAGGKRAGLVLPADAMTVQAANALLKTLEEPPSDAIILLVSHRPGLLPATIRSRCFSIACAFPTEDEALADIAESTGANPEAAKLAFALTGGRPGAARRLVEKGGTDLYRSIIDQLGGKAPFERTSLSNLGREIAGNFETGKEVLASFLWRAARFSSGDILEAVSEKEKAAFACACGKGNGADMAWRILQKIAEDTSHANLDTKYASYRMLLGIEHGAIG